MAKTKSTIEDWITEEKLTLISGWARDGLTMEEIAIKMNIVKSTLYKWMDKNKDLMNAIKNGKEVADYAVESALYKNAINGNVTAQIYWLNNRKPKQWKTRNNSESEDETDKKLELRVTVKDLSGKETSNDY